MLMANYYINRGIKLFNQLPMDIIQIYNINMFKLMVTNIYMRSFD